MGDEKASEAVPRQSEFTPEHVLAAEHAAIRSRAGARPAAKGLRVAAGAPEKVGLAFSGGGIRSAAFCLGVAQALHHHEAWPRIGYLSTVSGGGYIGCAITATMTKAKGEFVFANAGSANPDEPKAAEISDSPAVGHIRNYSNYLIPNGFRDFFADIAIVLRGLAANLLLVAPVLLALAAITIWANPTRNTLAEPDLFGLSLSWLIGVRHFGITKTLSGLLLATLAFWAIARSFASVTRLGEFQGAAARAAQTVLAVTLVSLVMETQPFVLRGLFQIVDRRGDDPIAWDKFASWITNTAKVAGPLVAAALAFLKQIGDLIKDSSRRSGPSAAAANAGGKALVWLAALCVPLIVWAAYLWLSFWGIVDDRAAAGGGDHTPRWLLLAATRFAGLFGFLPWFGDFAIARPLPVLYLAAASALFALGWQLTPNANSLHRLYRDRLSKAFLFDPTGREAKEAPTATGIPTAPADLKPIDGFRLSELATPHAPFHIINAALNIQGSNVSNRRGRNAEFFTFTPTHVGSTITGYAPTALMEQHAPGLDLATAMAVSGAAASSNMGSNSIKPLTPTLALLNIRLGYWLKNPGYVASGATPPDTQRASLFYLWSEIWGRLKESDSDVYLTDGGHIDNLGVYELLRRRCKLIIAVDAEADATLTFGSFVKLERYARIDLGIRIEMPWQAIRDISLASMGQEGKEDLGSSGDGVSEGPHLAIGTIDYGGGETGHLLYVKASLTGDENDYIRDYARRHPKFPHETTGDQFFSEEQFEVYRALGFHAIHHALDADKPDGVAVAGETGTERFHRSKVAAVLEVERLLGIRRKRGREAG